MANMYPINQAINRMSQDQLMEALRLLAQKHTTDTQQAISLARLKYPDYHTN